MQEIPIGIPVGRLAFKNGNGNGNGNGHPRFGEYGFEPQPGVVTVDVLNRLIKDNPNEHDAGHPRLDEHAATRPNQTRS